MLAGHRQEVQAERDRKLEAARQQRKTRRRRAASKEMMHHQIFSTVRLGMIVLAKAWDFR
jgi:hypothetical protein